MTKIQFNSNFECGKQVQTSQPKWYLSPVIALLLLYPVEAKKGQCCENFIYQQGPLLDGFSFTVRACEVKHDFSG